MTEDQIVQGLWEKDAAAFDELYSKLYRKFCAFANNLINDPIEAGDQASEAFIKLWNYKKRFASLEHINHFLFVVIKNSCISYIRKNKRHAQVQQQLLKTGKSSEDLIERKIQEADIFSRIYARIEALPEMRQKIFKLTYLEGLSRAEVATQLGISESTVKNQNTEAMKTLRIFFGVEKLLVLICLTLLLIAGTK
jgi:RNA polymerase sigma-70 factor (ECF subfamily)